MIKTIYLFRHGQTDWNKKEILQGVADIPLNSTGIEQAKIIADMLKNEELEHIYASPLNRAYNTGKVVADVSSIDIEIVDNLIEISFGDYAGKLKSEVKGIVGEEKYIEFSRKKGQDNMSYPNGEKKIDAVNRFTKCVYDIVKSTPYSRIGIAAHGFVIKMFLLYQDFIVEKMDNCAVIKIIFNDNKIEEVKF